nr:MAG TPA: hypothetical protein [Caudoviricetes sp.]
MYSSILCAGNRSSSVAAEPARATERSAGGRRASRVPERMEQEA